MTTRITTGTVDLIEEGFTLLDRIEEVRDEWDRVRRERAPLTPALETIGTTSSAWLRAAKHELGLTYAQMGAATEMGADNVHRMTVVKPGAKRFRLPPPRMIRLMMAYLALARLDSYDLLERAIDIDDTARDDTPGPARLSR